MSDSEGRLAGDEARSRLYDVMRAEGSTEDRIRRALTVGTEYFGVEYGYVAKVDPESDNWEVLISIDPDSSTVPEGLQVDYSTTYCRRTIQEETVVALHDGPDEAYAADPDFESHGVHCYHGAPVMVEGEAFGTVCFVSHDARGEPFSDSEKAFTDLIAQMVGSEIERERKQAALDARERELEKRQELYRAVIDASFDLLFRVDADGTYTYHSPTIEPMLGYTPDEIVGKPYQTLLPDDATAEVADKLFQRVLGGETAEERYLPLETAAGDIVYVDVRVTPIYAADVPDTERTPADIVAIQGMAHDATERKQRERLNRVLNRVLRHNLRNDMTVINGYADMLADRVDEADTDLVRRIRNTADRLLGMSETARELGDNFADPPTLEPLDVVPVVRGMVEQVASRDLAAEITVDAPDAAVASAAPRLETAIWELLDNAVRHAGDSPTVSVSVTVATETVDIRIADDGPGIPAQEATVLETGEETPLVHGSGLGLWLVYWIVSSLDGEVHVPEQTEGTTVRIRLPRVG
ncbi:MAG: ATP-binding protein [Haloarculaceae archaeon]